MVEASPPLVLAVHPFPRRSEIEIRETLNIVFDAVPL
jgi:hypothetical protein